MNKKWYASRTLWVNFIAFVAVILQVVTGKEYINPEQQAMILAMANFILRIITNTGLE